MTGAAQAAAAGPVLGPPPPKRPKKRKRLDAAGPGASAQTVYSDGDPRASVELNHEVRVGLHDIQALVLWVLGKGSNTRWAAVKNNELVSRVVLVAVPGLDADTFRAVRGHLPTLGGALGEPVATHVHKADVIHFHTVRTLFHVPMTKRQQREQPQGGATPAAPACALPPQHYRATLQELRDHDFPLPDVAPDGRVLCPPGYASSQPCEREGGPEHELVAIDCEMVADAAGETMLARVTAVSADGATLLDELVQPERPVADYATRFSGIVPGMLDGVATTVEDVRCKLLRFVSAETLLVGHALENDLRHLRLIHANVIDTSILYPHPQGFPRRTKLSRLAYRWLDGREIQKQTHDSREDAVAALDLAKLKFRQGPSFGVPDDDKPVKGQKLMAVLDGLGRRASLVDDPDTVNRHVTGRVSGVPAGSDAEAATRAAREAATAGVHFVWTQLKGFHAWQEARAAERRAAVDAYAVAVRDGGTPELPPLHDGVHGSPAPLDGGLPDAALTRLREVDAHLGRIHAALPPNSLLVVATCQGDTPEVRRLQTMGWRRGSGLDGLPPWSLACEAHLNRLRTQASRALCFATVKK